MKLGTRTAWDFDHRYIIKDIDNSVRVIDCDVEIMIARKYV